MTDLAGRISDSELEILKVLWQAEGPLSVAPIRTRLEEALGWDASTTKTLLRRLCDKGVVAAEKREVFYYHPLLSRAEYRRWSARSLVDRVFQGSARDLVASLVEEEQLSQDDLHALWGILHPEEDQNG